MANRVDSTSTGSPIGYASHESDDRARLVRHFLELIRFSHTIFALPFAALACVFALVSPSAQSLTTTIVAIRLVGVLMCMVTARSAAMAFNRLVDTHIDAANPRTANRHLPSGKLSQQQVWMFFALSSVLFMGSCWLFLPNWIPIAGSIPVLLWICGYSFAKRFTSAAHLWLGFALALSPVCAWLGLRGETVVAAPQDLFPAVVLAMAIVCWVAGFDIIYACQDVDFDRKQKLHSIPSRFGIVGALRISAGLHLMMLILLCVLPQFESLRLGWLYWISLLIVAALVATQHSLVRPNDLARVNLAFFHVNAALSLGFCSLAALDALW
jgi:4-hydroxybenzoate polyprenyltransferase